MKIIAIISLVTVFSVTLAGGQVQNDSLPGNGVTREGMFVSFGLGGALVSANPSIKSDYPRETGSGWTNMGLATSFRIGHAINTHWVIYYQNFVAFVNESTLENSRTSPRNSFFGNGLTGIGATYFRKETGPSHYFNVSVGLASRRDIEVVREYAESGMGPGFSLGMGYQFANRWSVEANLIYGSVKSKPDYDDPWESQFWSGQVSVNYLWFKSFKKERMARLGK